MSLFTELKRRNVLRVAAAYVVIGWLVLQVADIIIGFVGAPEWVGQLLISLLVLGFIPTMIFAWIFDVTPEGVKRDDSNARNGGEEARRLDYATIGAVVILACLTFYQMAVDRKDEPSPVDIAETQAVTAISAREDTVAEMADPPSPAANAPENSIAVLAFENMSAEADNEFFSDGISEEILNQLARIPELKVSARTSAFRFKNSDSSVEQIAGELNVRHVLEGSVRRAGEQVRVTAQLIDASNGFHLWSESFDRQLTDIFAIQDEIANSIVSALQDTLPGLEAPVDDVTGTDSIEAYNAFLQGRYFLHKRGRQNIQRAIELLEEAVRLDPGFADAQAQLARALSVGWGDDDLPRALAAAEQALALAPDSAMALMAFASAVEEFPERSGEGIAAIERSIELRPDLAEAHHLRAGYAARFETDLQACLKHERRAAELDPTAAIYPIWIGFCELGLGNAEQGIAAMEAGHALSPTGASLFLLAFTTAIALDGERAARQLANDPARSDIEPHLETIARATIEAVSGQKQAALRRMQAIGHPDASATFPSSAAWPYLIAGDSDTASDLLRRHADDPFLATIPFIIRYLPEDAPLEATAYDEVRAQRSLPDHGPGRTEEGG